MAKPKLDACEQRWVVKLALYMFSLKHIAGTKNVVADALSRDPFAKTVVHRLVLEPYHNLLAESDAVGVDGVQDVLRLKVQCYQTKRPKRGSVAWSRRPQPLSNDVVRAVLDSHDHWNAAAESRVTELIQSVQHLAPPGQHTLPAFSLQELNPGTSKIMPFLNRQRRPSRRERVSLDASAMVLVKQWERFKVID